MVYPLVNFLIHWSVFFSLLYPGYMTLRISKRVKGVLIGLWIPFELIFISLIPITVFHTILGLGFFAEITHSTNILYSIIQHSTIVLTFLLIGYSFSKMEKIFENYGIMVNKYKKNSGKKIVVLP